MSYNDVVGIPDSFSAYASFQYRLWFTWRGLPPDKLRQPHIYPDLWPETLSACPWLWDDESGDEECIKAFAEDSSLLPQMLLVDWANACRALQAHQSSTRTTLPHPLHPLTSEIRLYFIAWLMVTAPPQSRGDFEPVRKIEKFISDWAELIAMPDSPQCCDFCEISHILPLWIGTMRQVYELDHLRSIPRNHECSCWERYFQFLHRSS
ncbi:hypothetical protein C8F04DRAFT_1081294 [Mycena alexandri]|uniref:Uncharacterized protein n=1 Tax=Mycena alexandri TaxID=1745969 RepID=A0AAD6T701_9AGAR|nr:hypothetical protein C8F04DRAFT_1081294 [Mycena alexandri]